ncbi:terminase small subunit [Chromobacterium phragmitis]|uniref:Terminase small subunit n=1 Tax=Chromobacterium phragmitis TaxID=2202141 RepID=A0A344UPE1_9NEIS|nr:terminase small subunit [Chromobacterium phragmitis]AXE37139.1 terminase small subunit [Chromobacterium phragmitis]
MARARSDSDPTAELTPLQEGFWRRYTVHFNATQAAIEAGYSPKTAKQQASQLLQHPAIAHRLAAWRRDVREVSEQDRALLIAELWDVALADANDLVELRRNSCRYCHGAGHLYQYTQREWAGVLQQHAKDCEEARADGKELPPLPDPQGGVGFNPKLAPAANCPECHGDGEEQAFFHDTRTLPAGARRLYSGVKITKDGLEVKLQDRAAALEKLMRHYGLYERDNQQQGGGLAESMRELIQAAGLASGGALRPDPGNGRADDGDDDEED